MPRKSRIDSPGSLHHIMCRGIERRKVFDKGIGRNDVFLGGVAEDIYSGGD
jgi:putative transposase